MKKIASAEDMKKSGKVVYDSRLPLISLFSGAGGLDFAFQSAGTFSTKLFVEYEALFAETLRINQRSGLLGNGCIVEADISTLDPSTAWMDAMGASGSPWGIIGGPPCESFSVIGKQAGSSDERGKLVFAFAKWVAALPIKVFVMENVPNLLAIQKGSVFIKLIEQFEKAGFDISHTVLRAADYGAPTMRRRLFVVGVRGLPKFIFPSPTHADPKTLDESSQLSPWVPSKISLNGLPTPATVPPGEPQGHVRINHTDAVSKRFTALAPGAIDHIRKRNRLHPDLPAPGLYAGNMGGIRFHIHPTEHRELTNREAARIQGFPDSYFFNGTRVPVGKQIANAVPIALGVALAKALANQYGCIENSKPADSPSNRRKSNSAKALT